VIAIAFGLKKDGLPDIVTTGFGVDDHDGAISTEFFACPPTNGKFYTCSKKYSNL
jgi:hypothetical protein